MARTVQRPASSFGKRRPLMSMVNTTYAAKKAKMRSESYVLFPATRPGQSYILAWDHPSVRRDVSSSSQPATEVVLLPNKPNMKSPSKNLSDWLAHCAYEEEDLVVLTKSEPYSEISFQDALEGVVPPAPNKPRTRSRSKSKVSTN